MTIRQLYYTSCRTGTEGIEGFQVNAQSPGLDHGQADAGLQLSLYRPSPSAPSIPTPAQLDALPVTLGYRSFGDHAVLFHSRYLGADFTGRQGNYFAHVLVLDAPEADLAGTLPVDAWRAPDWRWAPVDRPELPELPGPPSGDLDRFSVGEHLRSGRLPEFGVLLTAVAAGLGERRSRIVLVAQGAEAVALAVAAVTRSLPRTLATEVSFVTFTSDPGDTDVLVAGTSADVSVPASPLGTQTVLRLGDGEAAGGRTTGRYARVLRDCWSRSDDEAEEMVALASSIRPPVTVGELDELAHLLELAVPEPGVPVPDLDLLTALEFGLRRCPAVLRAPVWARVAGLVGGGVPDTDVERWSAVLTAAAGAGMAPPPVLLHEYLTTVLTGIAAGTVDPGRVWMPEKLTGAHERTTLDWAERTLDRDPSFTVAATVLDTLSRVGVALAAPTLAHLVDRVVVPQLTDPDTAATAATELYRMAASEPDVPRLACAALDRMVAEPHGMRRAAAALPPEVAGTLAAHAARGSGTALLLDVVDARAGRRDRVPVLVAALGRGNSGRSGPDVELFTDLLWPETPGAADGAELCAAVRPEVLATTGVPARLVERLEIDAAGPGLSGPDYELAKELSRRPVMQSLRGGERTVQAVQFVRWFESGPKHAEGSAADVIRCLDGLDAVSPAVRERTADAAAAWIMSADDPVTHAWLLGDVLQSARVRGDLLDAYDARLIPVLRDGRPAEIAAVLPVLAALAPWFPDVRPLLDTTATMVLTGRSMRDREAVAKAIGRDEKRLRPLLKELGRSGPRTWSAWWDDWQKARLSTSLVSRLVARRRTSKAADR